MRAILVVAGVSAMMTSPADAPQYFRCLEDGYAQFYRIGPGEFRRWGHSGPPDFTRDWLDNECAKVGTSCSWNAGVITIDDHSNGWQTEFNTNTGLLRFGPRDNPGKEQCSKESGPPAY